MYIYKICSCYDPFIKLVGSRINPRSFPVDRETIVDGFTVTHPSFRIFGLLSVLLDYLLVLSQDVVVLLLDVMKCALLVRNSSLAA